MGLVVLGIIAVVKYVWDAPDDDPASASTALHILEKRYARGEIDRNEFEQKKHDIGA